MKTKRSVNPKAQHPDEDIVIRSADRRRARTDTTSEPKGRATKPRTPAEPARTRKAKGAKATRGRAPGREPRGLGTPPGHAPATTPVRRPAPAKNASQAKARAKARKAKAPKVVRVPLRQRIITRLETIDLRPQALAARVPFVVLVIGALGVGLGVTLWLSTDAAERSYQLGSAKQTNEALLQQKEALERDVLEAQAAPALAEAARGLGMIPSRDTAHLVQDPAGNWMVVGTPKPAEGAPPPPLNSPLPENTPAPRPQAATAAQDPGNPERPVRISGTPGTPSTAGAPGAPAAALPAGPEVPVRIAVPGAPAGTDHAPAGPPAEPLAAGVAPGPVTGPAPGPVTGPLPGPVEPAPVEAPAVPLAADPAIVPPPVADPAAVVPPVVEPAPAPAPPGAPA